MQLKINQEKVDAFKNTAVGKRAFADFTKEVGMVHILPGVGIMILVHAWCLPGSWYCDLSACMVSTRELVL